MHEEKKKNCYVIYAYFLSLNLRLPFAASFIHSLFYTCMNIGKSIWFWEMAIALSKVYIYSLFLHKSIVMLLLAIIIIYTIIISFCLEEEEKCEGKLTTP